MVQSEKEEKIQGTVCEATLESDKVTSVVYDRAVIKMENAPICGSTRRQLIKKSIVHRIIVRLKAKEIYSHIQVQENVKPISASAGWLTRFRRRSGMTLLNVKARQIPQIRRLWEKLIKMPVKCYTGKGLHGRVGFQTLMRLAFFYKDTGQQLI